MTVIKKNLTFGDAMNALRKGYKVTRSVWGGYWFIPHEVAYMDDNGKWHQAANIALTTLRTGGLPEPAQPYNIEMRQSHDWEILK